MLNTQKLLYVLPDLAYIAELLPDKKPYSFAIQSFKQVNGEFLNETEFIAENIVKLINKLEIGEEYFLVLPDFLFTNTIVSVQETSDTKIKEELNSKILPELGLKDDSHLVETVVLNQLKGTTRVQLSAIEKSVLSVFKVAIAEKDIRITGVAPLSWTVKSLVSLEPSISVLQLGTKLYTAQHYIGVDQTTTATVDHPENIVETIKTLKGAEPSIQTVYLCSNSIIEEKLKEFLSKILPIQQMAAKDTNDKIPSYVSQIIIATQRTLAIPDYSVPIFKLTKPSPEEKEQYAAILTAAGVATTEDAEDEVVAEIPKPTISPVPAPEVSTAEPEESKEPEKAQDKLPEIEEAAENDEAAAQKPIELPEIEDASKDEEVTTKDQDKPADILPTAAAIAAGASAVTSTASAATAVTPPAFSTASENTVTDTTPAVIVGQTLSEPPKTESTEAPVQEKEPENTYPIKEIPPVVIGASAIDSPESETMNAAPTSSSDEDIDLKQFAQNGETAVESSSTPKPVIKNKGGGQHMMKMILITTGVFVLTVAIGIGVGFAILKFSGKSESSPPPAVEVEQPTPTPVTTATPTPAASASAEIDKDTLSILVVNATTKAGYAGQIQTKLKSGDFKKVDTGNAKGDYSTEGNFIYMKTANSALQSAIEDATDLKFTATDSAKVEDTPGKYDAVVVLNE